MNVIDIEAATWAHADRECARWSELASGCAEAIRGAMNDPAYAATAVSLVVMIARLQAFDELRLAAAGYEPQPLQDILARKGIISAALVADVKRNNQEARH